MLATEIMIEALKAHNVERIFSVPGEENLDLVEALRKSDIELVICRHEQAAGFMAATWGRLTGRAGVCLATLGPGATNLVTAAAYATLGGMPMVMITGQKPIKKSKQGEFQIIDIIDVMEPVTKYTRQLVGADLIPARVSQAFRIAEEERPGATHLELPEDIARETTDAHVIVRNDTRRPVAEKKATEKAVALIKASKSPLLLIGAGSNRKRTSVMLTRFVNELGIPFVSTQMGKGVVDENHPLFIGTTALSEGDFVHRAITGSDLIINAGHDVVEKPPFLMDPKGFKVIHFNFSPALIDPVYFPQVEVVGDIANAIWQILQSLKSQKSWEFDGFMAAKAAFEAHTDAKLPHSPTIPIHPLSLVEEVSRVMSESGIVSLDNGLYKIWFARHYKARLPNSLLLDNALASMGAGLPAAMAASIAEPNRRVMAVCGDGGFMMNSQEMETAVRLKLNLVILVLRDDGFGMIRWKQESMDLTDYGTEFSNPDFVAYANAYGAQGHRLNEAEQLGPLINDVFERGGVHLIEVAIDYSDSSSFFFDKVKKASQLL